MDMPYFFYHTESSSFPMRSPSPLAIRRAPYSSSILRSSHYPWPIGSSSPWITRDASFTTIFTTMLDQLFEQDRFQEAIQHSLDSYQNELFRRGDAYVQLSPQLFSSLSQEKTMEENKNCPICLEHFSSEDQVYELSCHHRIHATCLDESVRFQHSTCPLCRESIPLVVQTSEEHTTGDGHIICIRSPSLPPS